MLLRALDAPLPQRPVQAPHATHVCSTRVLHGRVTHQSPILPSLANHLPLCAVYLQVARAGGVRSDEEARALNARISKLTGVLEKVNAEHAMLLEQVRTRTGMRALPGMHACMPSWTAVLPTAGLRGCRPAD